MTHQDTLTLIAETDRLLATARELLMTADKARDRDVVRKTQGQLNELLDKRLEYMQQRDQLAPRPQLAPPPIPVPPVKVRKKGET